MAIVANTFTTHSAIGRREDLADTIYNISPSDVPFMSMIGRSKATNTLESGKQIPSQQQQIMHRSRVTSMPSQQ